MKESLHDALVLISNTFRPAIEYRNAKRDYECEVANRTFFTKNCLST